MIIKLLKEKLAKRLAKKKLENFIKRTFSWWEKLDLDEKIDFLKGFFPNVAADNYEEKWCEFLNHSTAKYRRRNKI
jgi:hypothetical protein